MEEYINKYDTLEKKIVYDFHLGSGGIGDLTKYFMYLLNICIEHNIKLYYLVSNITVEKYLKLKYEKMYITNETILISNNINRIRNIHDIQYLNTSDYYIVNPDVFYDIYIYNELTIPLQEVFCFSDEVKVNTNHFLCDKTNYISIHLRLGDKHLETDKSFVNCKEDSRNYDEYKLFDFIEKNQETPILFFCDNNSYKLKIKSKYNHIFITDYDIGHTSLSNTTNTQVLNTLKEFYLLTNSEHIYMASHSGFPIMASKFKNIPITEL